MSRSKPQEYRPEPIQDVNTKLQFGKYKGKTIAEVMENDKQYLAWLHNNSVFFELSPELLEQAEGWQQEELNEMHRFRGKTCLGDLDDYEPTLQDIYGKP